MLCLRYRKCGAGSRGEMEKVEKEKARNDAEKKEPGQSNGKGATAS